MAGEQVRIVASHDDYQEAEIMVVVPAEEQVELELGAAVLVEGRVLSPDGDVVPQAVVTVSPASRMTRRGRGGAEVERTDSDGRFGLKVEPDTSYSLEARSRDWAPSEPLAPRSHVARSQRSRALPAAGLESLRSSHRCRRLALEGVRVMARGNKRTSTDELGRYALDGLRSGETTVVAGRQDGSQRIEQIVLEPGENTLDFSFSGGILTGTVSSVQGEPAAQAVVQLDPAESSGRRQRPRRVATDESGGFRFEDVPGGLFQVRATKDGVGSSETSGWNSSTATSPASTSTSNRAHGSWGESLASPSTRSRNCG